MSKERYQKEAEETIENVVKGIAQLYQEHPYYFINEEDIRCMLNSKVSKEYPEPIYYKKKTNGEVFLSNAVHSDVIIEGKHGSQEKPDLLLYFAKDNKENPILTFHKIKRSKSGKESLDHYRRKVHFFETNSQAGDIIDQRIIVEIKINRRFNEIQGKKEKEVLGDIDKVKEWDFLKSYILFFDRSNKITGEFISKIEERIYQKRDKRHGAIEFIYVGYSKDKKGKYIHLKKS
jgi:hypothetical protein